MFNDRSLKPVSHPVALGCDGIFGKKERSQTVHGKVIILWSHRHSEFYNIRSVIRCLEPSFLHQRKTLNTAEELYLVAVFYRASFISSEPALDIRRSGSHDYRDIKASGKSDIPPCTCFAESHLKLIAFMDLNSRIHRDLLPVDLRIIVSAGDAYDRIRCKVKCRAAYRKFNDRFSVRVIDKKVCHPICVSVHHPAYMEAEILIAHAAVVLYSCK